LAPKISPNKTVSGALGGIALAIAVGVAVAVIGGAGTVWIIAVLSLLIAMISQVGDLTESSAKRRYGVKDTSNILPGHGGVLDRFDGLIAATIFVALLELVAGSSVFTW
jgi:phosphatidate cytidylyltransferase